MDNLAEIIKKRLPPGVLIFDLDDRLLYSNREALELLALQNRGENGRVPVPEGIYDLCRQLKGGTETPHAAGTAAPLCQVLADRENPPCSVRAFLIGDHLEGSNPTHIMVLLERVVERHEVDIEKARREFGLSKREAELVRLIGRGMANREIGETLFISEHTVKDHLKNIMRKMRAGSRNEIIALLK